MLTLSGKMEETADIFKKNNLFSNQVKEKIKLLKLNLKLINFVIIKQ